MLSLLGDFESSLKTFLTQMTSALGFGGLFAIAIAVELFLVILFVLKTSFSYEARLHRSLDKLNNWLFRNKRIDQSNIKQFNELVNKCPKRIAHNWQQYILFREKAPSEYLSVENLIEKPLKTSGWTNNIRNLNFSTTIWTIVMLLLSIAYQINVSANFTAISFAMAIFIPVLVIIIGIIGAISLRGKKILNLDDIYQKYHIFARFLNNACVDLPQYIDYDLLFTQKEIEKGNPQLREYYESCARKAKEEFENAKKSDVEYVEYNFEEAGVDGSLVLERAMRETEAFINKKTSTLAKIAHVDAQKEALKRNYENVQKDLQRKIQASKENINKLIAQQEATTNRMEVGFLRKQQEQEIAKQESLQQEYDQEETRYTISSEELEKEVAGYKKQLEDSKTNVQDAMVAEYQSFYEKVMKSAYSKAERLVKDEKADLKAQRDQNERELIIVQTQIKRLLDENNTLRAMLDNGENLAQSQNSTMPQGKYDEQGNYIYEDGSYHDANGLFHDIDGNIYDMNGALISIPSDNETKVEQEIKEEQLSDEKAFGSFVFANNNTSNENDIKNTATEQPIIEEYKPEAEEYNSEAEVFNNTNNSQDLSNNSFNDNIDEEESTQNEQIEQVTQIEEAPVKRRGRPKKVVTEEVMPKEPKKRGRPRKEEGNAKTEVVKRSVGRPSKSTSTNSSTQKRNPYKKTAPKAKEENSELNSLAKISKMISDEEDKLNKMKMIIDSEISDVMLGDSYQNEINSERDEIMKAVEALKAKAETVKESEKSEEELASINKRLEDLISEIATLNAKK